MVVNFALDHGSSIHEVSGSRIGLMSYVIRTTGGKVIVIDGGTTGDAPYLRGFLAALGSNVQAWFITHPHSDHVGALGEILPPPQGLTIGSIYASMPDSDWVAKYVPRDEVAEVTDFQKAPKAPLANKNADRKGKLRGARSSTRSPPRTTGTPCRNATSVRSRPAERGARGAARFSTP